jgi:hypothetical protein
MRAKTPLVTSVCPGWMATTLNRWPSTKTGQIRKARPAAKRGTPSQRCVTRIDCDFAEALALDRPANCAIAAVLCAAPSRSGANVTGITSLNVELAPKRLELLHEMVPTATTIALLVNPTSPNLAEPEAQEMGGGGPDVK